MCRGVLQELDSVVNRARMFQYKPDGEVTFRMAQDAVGLPAPLMQDPIHYPHGTKFMAPGASPHSLRILPSIEASVGAVCSVSANALQSDGAAWAAFNLQHQCGSEEHTRSRRVKGM